MSAAQHLSRTGVCNTCKRHAAKGAQGLHGAEGGRKVGEHRRLNASQKDEVQRLIADKTPDQLKMVYPLLTRQAVAQLINQRLGVWLPVRTIGLYLSRWRQHGPKSP